MQVYKAFFKIILKNKLQIMIYIVVFLSIAIALANTYSTKINTNFTETKVNIAFISHDSQSKLVQGLRDYLSENSNIIDIPDETQKLQDALFHRKIEYIVRVPQGFTEGLMNGEPVKIERTAVPNSTSEIYLDSLINKYLNTAKMYSSSMGHLSEEQIISYVTYDLSQNIEVKLNNSADVTSKNENLIYYFNYLAYSLYAVLILGVSSVLMVFNDPDLKKRNLSSPMNLKSINFQLILGNLTFAVLVWFILILASFFMYGSYLLTAKGLLLLLNSFVFTFAVLSISYLIGNIVKSKGAMSAAANVVALGTSFISGVFVPQALLGKAVLKIASFTPNYWYITANNSIANIATFNMENLTPIFLNMFIVIGFAAAFLSVTMVFIKQTRMSN